MVMLRLDGRPIAMQCNIHARMGAFSYKISYDEAFSRCSPGILVATENLRFALDHSGLSWMDSGADPNHAMIDRLWRDRRLIGSFNVGLRTLRGRIAYGTILAARLVYKLFRKAPSAADYQETQASPEDGGGNDHESED